MGNLCAAGDSNTSEARIKAAIEEEQKRNLEEGLRNMANGGHQMIAGFTAPYEYQREPDKQYYQFNWGPEGEVLVTSFGVKIASTGSAVEFVEGLANYATFTVKWCRWQSDDVNEADFTFICLDDYKSVDANTGEEARIPTCAKKFLVSSTGQFERLLNTDELVNEAIEVAVQASADTQHKTPQQRDELKTLLMAQRDVMIKGVVDDIALMWRCWVEVWTSEIKDSNTETLTYNHLTTKRRKVISSSAQENKQQLEKFYDDLFANMNRDLSQQQSLHSAVFRPEVVLERAKQLQVYNALFDVSSLRCHQCEYRKYTESSISIQGLKSERCEFEGKRWVFAWTDVPELASRPYMVSLFSEYASVGASFHDALTQLIHHKNNQINMFEMLITHPFNTEPNDEVVEADQQKQRLAGLLQMACGAHAMFSGLSPTIQYPPLPHYTSSEAQDYFKFQWPSSGSVRICALGFTIKVTDEEVQFTQGLGTFITFDCRWKKCEDTQLYKNAANATTTQSQQIPLTDEDLIDCIELFLENNVLVNAQSGSEEVLFEPVKHVLISRSGELLRVLNMSELIEFAVDTAIIQKGNISEQEKAQYREMLERTQLETLTTAVKCDLSCIWSSWVQLWTHVKIEAIQADANTMAATPHREVVKFSSSVSCVEAEFTNTSDPQYNKQSVLKLINSVLGDNKHQLKHITVDEAQQSEHYVTLFERVSLRPFIASYEKISSTRVSFLNRSIEQREFKHCQHVFLWPDLPELSSKQYIQAVYQQYLDQANHMYSQLKAQPDKHATTNK